MKRYIHSLDYTAMALAAAIDGDLVRAGKALLKASKQHDAKRAVQVLEASNAQAFDADIAASVTAKAKTKAATKPAPKAVAKAAAKPAPVGAAARVKAAQTQVKAFDMGADEDIDSLLEDEGEAPMDEGADEVGAEAMDDMDDGEDEGENNFDTAFASVLRGMGAK